MIDLSHSVVTHNEYILFGFTCFHFQEEKSTPAVNFINVKHSNFSYEHCFGSFFSSYMYVVKELPKQHSYEKFVCLPLMKLTPRVNFTNRCAPSVNRIIRLLLSLLCWPKAADTLQAGKRTSGVDFTNICFFVQSRWEPFAGKHRLANGAQVWQIL